MGDGPWLYAFSNLFSNPFHLARIIQTMVCFFFLIPQAGEAYIITDPKPQNQFVWMAEFVEAMGYSMPRLIIPVFVVLTIGEETSGLLMNLQRSRDLCN